MLIDSRVDSQGLVDARKGDVEYLVFDFAADTYSSLVASIAAKQGEFTEIGLVQHSRPRRGPILILQQEAQIDSGTAATWDGFKGFLEGIRIAKPTLGYFDFLACNLYDPETMASIFSDLETETGVHLRASSTITGNLPTGDWLMESDGTDVRDVYFTDAIDAWTGNLGGLYTYYRFITTHLQGKGGCCKISEMIMYGRTAGDITTRVYPPVGMTADSTTISGQGYGNGAYTSSASSVGYGWLSYNAFDRDNGRYWHSFESAPSVYSNTDGGSTPGAGSGSTTVAGSVVRGEWLQIQMPQTVELYSLTIQNNDGLQRFADGMTVAGSNNGTAWDSVYVSVFNDSTRIVNIFNGGTSYTAHILVAPVFTSHITRVVITPVPRGAAVPPGQPRFFGFGGGFIRGRAIVAPSFTPASISGLNLWLDAQNSSNVLRSGSNVTAWNDSSAVGNNFTATGTPAYTSSAINGFPAITFSDISSLLSNFINISPTNQLSFFIIGRQTGDGTGNDEIFSVSADQASSANPWRYFDLFRTTGNVISLNMGSETSVASGISYSTYPTTWIISVVLTSTNGSLFYNGTITNINGTSRGGGAVSLNNNLQYMISGAGFRGDIGEILSYPSVLSTTDRQKAEGYLAWKWGIQASLPVGHPYKNAAP